MKQDRFKVVVAIAALCFCSLSAMVQSANSAQDANVVVGFTGKKLPKDPSLDPAASYTPPQYRGVAATHGWIELADEEDARWWMAYKEASDKPGTIHLAVKRATKGAGNGFTSIDIIDGEAICASAGVAPNYLHNVMNFSYDSRGVPTSGGMVAAVFTLTRGSVLAEGAKEACEHVDRAAASAGAQGKQAFPDPLFKSMDEADRGKKKPM